MLQHQPFEIPDEVVREILIWLPVEFLARFKSVSKAWLAIISDPSFVPAHLQCSKKKEKQNPSSFLITPHILLGPGHVESFSTDIRFYQWCLTQVTEQGTGRSAKLLCRRHFPAGEFGAVAPMAHCDGLLLLPTDTKVYVFNPATKDAIALPQSQRNMMRHYGCLSVGLGLDTSTGKYKVARTFHRSCDDGPMEIFTMGMEVFTINGENGSWRETSVDLPYPILGSQAGIYCKGCLFFFIDKNNQQIPPQRLLRFSLLDETFGVTPLLTNLYPSVDDEDIFVNELDGELCASLFSKANEMVGGSDIAWDNFSSSLALAVTAAGGILVKLRGLLMVVSTETINLELIGDGAPTKDAEKNRGGSRKGKKLNTSKKLAASAKPSKEFRKWQL
nr:unnamed protein product [Digitaria exilis]